jgi:zinc/manganese transport system permease protein
MFAHEFIRNAYLAGSLIALACGLVGWLVVLRAQVFAGDALSHVAFVGAIAAATIGLDERVGLFALTLLLAAAMGALGRRAQPDDVTIGIVFAWILGLGAFFIALLATSSAGGSGISTANTLFGSILSLGAGQARLAALIGAGAVVAVLVIVRPLVFASLDPDVAAARGVPVRALGIVFLLILAVVTAEGTQAVGALQILGLLAAPAGAAQALTARPWLGLVLSGAIAVGSVWAGLALSYAIPKLPPSSAIIALAAGAFVVAQLGAGRAFGRRLVQSPTGADAADQSSLSG